MAVSCSHPGCSCHRPEGAVHAALSAERGTGVAWPSVEEERSTVPKLVEGLDAATERPVLKGETFVDETALAMLVIGDSPAIVQLLRAVRAGDVTPEDCARTLSVFLQPR